jgi:hypothetical protein
MTVTLEGAERRITSLHLYFKDIKAEPVPRWFGTSTEMVDLMAGLD